MTVLRVLNNKPFSFTSVLSRFQMSVLARVATNLRQSVNSKQLQASFFRNAS